MKMRQAPKNGLAFRKFCECGRPATIMLNNARVCKRCHDLDRGARYHDRDGLRSRVGYVYHCSLIK
jgi:hypothetical protein